MANTSVNIFLVHKSRISALDLESKVVLVVAV